MQKRARTEKPRVRMDIRDVARRAGVSISTVSRVTNGKGTVNREMADRVWRAVREFNYQPDPQARALNEAVLPNHAAISCGPGSGDGP